MVVLQVPLFGARRNEKTKKSWFLLKNAFEMYQPTPWMDFLRKNKASCRMLLRMDQATPWMYFFLD